MKGVLKDHTPVLVTHDAVFDPDMGEITPSYVKFTTGNGVTCTLTGRSAREFLVIMEGEKKGDKEKGEGERG